MEATQKLGLLGRIKQLKWTRVHQLLHDQHGVRYFVMALGIIIAIGLALVAWLSLYKEPAVVDQKAPVAVKKEAPKYYSPLTGIALAEEAPTKRPVTAIMIENSPDARPQSGLKEAGIVYEAIAEGGITRFVALYQEARPGLVGPVRSVRPYYVEWAAGYDAGVAHIGGSANALTMIRSGNYGVDLDQFFNAGSYWRAADRAAPHNVYTDFNRLDALMAAKGKAVSNFTGFARKDDKKASAPNASQIHVAISSGLYDVNYAYDAASNSYVRSEGGAPHTDREGGQLSPKVAVVLRVQNTTVFEDGYRQSYQVVGSGQAYVFQDGTVQEVTWTKTDPKAPLLLRDATGRDVQLNRGQTWVTAVAPDKAVTWQ